MMQCCALDIFLENALGDGPAFKTLLCTLVVCVGAICEVDLDWKPFFRFTSIFIRYHGYESVPGVPRTCEHFNMVSESLTFMINFNESIRVLVRMFR